MVADFSSVVLSVALLCPNQPEPGALGPLSASLAEQFPYYELLIVANPLKNLDDLEQELMRLPNSRLVVMNNFAPEYVLREKAFETAIGDQVLLWGNDEAELARIPELVDSNLGGRDFSGLVYPDKDPTAYALGVRLFTSALNRITGYALNPRLSSTGCYSRALVNAINARESGTSYLKLLLASLGFRHAYLEGAVPARKGARQMFRRLADSLEIIGSVPHRLLKLTAWASLASCLACFLYILYVCCVWFFAPAVQPGWTTTSLAFSTLFAVLFFALFVFSCIFLNRLGKEDRGRFAIARENSRNDYIRSFSELNITHDQK